MCGGGLCVSCEGSTMRSCAGRSANHAVSLVSSEITSVAKLDSLETLEKKIIISVVVCPPLTTVQDQMLIWDDIPRVVDCVHKMSWYCMMVEGHTVHQLLERTRGSTHAHRHSDLLDMMLIVVSTISGLTSQYIRISLGECGGCVSVGGRPSARLMVLSQI